MRWQIKRQWVLSMGQCANSEGGCSDGFCTVQGQGVDMLVPVGASR